MHSDGFRYLFLLIIVASYVQAQENTRSNRLEKAQEKRISKREAAIFIDNFPIIPISRHSPSVIYRKVSKQRYRSPKPKYGPPLNVYHSSKPRKPFKKYRRTIKPKYGPPNYKKYPTRTSYGPPKLPKYKPVYGPPKKTPHSSHYTSDPDFGEPPKEYVSDFQTYKQHFGEPPTDSYGTPLHTVNEPQVSNHYTAPTGFADPSTGFDNLDTFGPETGSWQGYQSDQNFDNSYAYSKKHPVFIKPQSFEEQEEVDPTLYVDIRPHKGSLVEREPLPFKKKRKPFYANEYIKTRRPPKQSLTPEEILVGGRYAEPPARYVNKAKSTASLYTDDDEFPASNEFIDPDVAISATSSPYVNYKNSNMAFSPQNLNDAFSIIDK